MKLTREKMVVASVLVASAGILWLAATNNLTLYVHPNYVVFTVIMAVVAVVGVIGYYAFTAKPETKRSGGITASSVFIVLALGLFPASSLSMQDGESETSHAVSKPQETVSEPIAIPVDSIVHDTDMYKIQMRYANQGIDSIDGEYVSFTAYTYQSKDQPSWSYLTRKMVSCCVVDARSLDLLYPTSDESSAMKDSWVAVTGKLVRGDEAGSWYYFEMSSITEVAEPGDPYLYFDLYATGDDF